ncbi:MAG: ASPIC/UnbV domain-containing protein, partial [Acidobacteriaceae bacterium]|nr:ASPIC/UnbV domain-containing protein [Acidobacteriaceae bacterium]
PRAHFGLGSSRTVREVEIRWPSGVRQVLRDVAANRIVNVEEPR